MQALPDGTPDDWLAVPQQFLPVLEAATSTATGTQAGEASSSSVQGQQRYS